MTEAQDSNHPRKMRHYYVDEAGDGVLFDRSGGATVGREGCSRFFILGHTHVEYPESLERELVALRRDLLADPYFRKVPSMQPDTGKTARFFHAKDDVPEVRREVFALLLRQDIRFYAAVRNKKELMDYVARRNQSEREYRYNPNELYDGLVRHSFSGRLHQADRYEITFARRGKGDRTLALHRALEGAKRDFYYRHGKSNQAILRVTPAHPWERPCLQATDYLLWALQRFYERNESRYLELIWPTVRLVHDIDDRKRKKAVPSTRRKGRSHWRP